MSTATKPHAKPPKRRTRRDLIAEQLPLVPARPQKVLELWPGLDDNVLHPSERGEDQDLRHRFPKDDLMADLSPSLQRAWEKRAQNLALTENLVRTARLVAEDPMVEEYRVPPYSGASRYHDQVRVFRVKATGWAICECEGSHDGVYPCGHAGAVLAYAEYVAVVRARARAGLAEAAKEWWR